MILPLRAPLYEERFISGEEAAKKGLNKFSNVYSTKLIELHANQKTQKNGPLLKEKRCVLILSGAYLEPNHPTLEEASGGGDRHENDRLL